MTPSILPCQKELAIKNSVKVILMSTLNVHNFQIIQRIIIINFFYIGNQIIYITIAILINNMLIKANGRKSNFS